MRPCIKQMHYTSLITGVLSVFAASVLSATDLYNVRDYGATDDGKTLDSPAINKAISAAAAAGGGTVLLPAGIYLSETIHLKSRIHLLSTARYRL